MFIEDPVNGQAVESDIRDFPIVSHEAMRTGRVKGTELEVLLETRAGFEVSGVLHSLPLPYSEEVCDLWPLRPVMDFSVAEARRVIAKFRDRYELADLEALCSA
jgi:hypothetical protein